MSALESRLRASDIRTLVGSVPAENSGAVAFHLALGFETVARLRGIGQLHGRSADVILVQKKIA